MSAKESSSETPVHRVSGAGGDGFGSGRRLGLSADIEKNEKDNTVAYPTHSGSEGDVKSPAVLRRNRVRADAMGSDQPHGEGYAQGSGDRDDADTEPDDELQEERDEYDGMVLCRHGVEWVAVP